MASYFDTVTLVDRSGLGGVDIIYDGQIIKFEKGQVEKPVPQILVEWLYRVDQQKVHTTDGEYVQRFGVRNPPEELIKSLGEEPDCTPIQIDNSRVEGWDSDRFAIDRDPAKTQVKQLKRNPGDFGNDATAGGFARAR